MIAAGSDPRRAKDKDGDPVLVTAAFRDGRAALRAFLTVPHAEDVKSLALLEAAGSGYLDAAKLLVKHGADPTWKSSKGNSAVSIARKKKKTELVAYFKSLAE